jgi:signal transduction histidine kinase
MLARPLWSLAHRGLGYALIGAVTGALPLPFGVLAAAATPGPPPVRVACGLAVVAAAVAVVALPQASRRWYVAVTNGLLKTGLPAPVRPHRRRTAAWAVLHTAAGGTLALTAGLLAAVGLGMPVLWLDGGDHMTYLGLHLYIAAGWPGTWVLPFALAHLAAAAGLCLVVTALYRALAPVLLGPSATDRLAAVQQRAELLARRNRLARELHDSIGHTLTASTIQAAAAGRLMDTDPELARRALGSIEEASRTALADLDHVLGVLREGPAPREPAYTLADLDPLLSRVRHAGAEVDVEVTGDLHRVPATVSREAYRIVQEGLTNVLRHAGPAPVTVRLAVGSDRLEVALTNPVPAGTLSERPGRGLTGIAERVRMLRGDMAAGADPGGEWRLTAWLPLPSEP